MEHASGRALRQQLQRGAQKHIAIISMGQTKQPVKQIQMLMGWTANGALLTAAATQQQSIALEAHSVMRLTYPIMKLNAKTQQDANGEHAGKRDAGITHPNPLAMPMLIVTGQIPTIVPK